MWKVFVIRKMLERLNLIFLGISLWNKLTPSWFKVSVNVRSCLNPPFLLLFFHPYLLHVWVDFLCGFFFFLFVVFLVGFLVVVGWLGFGFFTVVVCLLVFRLVGGFLKFQGKITGGRPCRQLVFSKCGGIGVAAIFLLLRTAATLIFPKKVFAG